MAANAALVAFNAHLQQFQFTPDVRDALNVQGITSYTSLHDTYNRSKASKISGKDWPIQVEWWMIQTTKDQDQYHKFEREELPWP
jgi:hypothetical protein